MKIIILVIVGLVILGGCSDRNKETLHISLDDVSQQSKEVGTQRQNNKENGETDIVDTEDGVIADYLKEQGLPLEGINVFDPKSIKVGDSVLSFKLKWLEVVPATKQYPIDTVVASFSGETIVTGVIRRTREDDEFFPNVYTMGIGAEESVKLPVSHHDTRNRWLIFENTNEVHQKFDLAPDEERKATVRLKEFTINYLPTETADTAILMDIIE